jgi:hypothetical protein
MIWVFMCDWDWWVLKFYIYSCGACLSQSFNACDMFGWCRDWPTGQKHTQRTVAIGWGGFGNFISKIIV